jgi:hypothetical protein
MRPPRSCAFSALSTVRRSAFGEIDRAFAVARGFRDAIERLFGFFDLRLGRLFVRRFIGRVDDVLADMDERAAHRQIVQDARIIAHIGQRGRGLRQAREIGVPPTSSGRDRPSSRHAASAA